MTHFFTGAKITAAVAILILLLPSCTSKQEQAAQMEAANTIARQEKQIQELQNQLNQKEKELVEKRNIEKELSNLIVQAYNYEKYQDLYMYAGTYLKLFPESSSYNAYSNYFEVAKDNIEENKSSNTPSYQDYSTLTGIWKLAHFIDDYGNSTNSAYITTNEILKGTFTDKSNTNAYLEVYPIISSDTNIAFMLYEQGGSTEVKATTRNPVNYDISIIDGDGDVHTLKGKNTSDRVVLNSTYSKELNSYLQNGGYIQIVMKTTRDNYPVTYRFTIQDATFYNNVYRQLYAER